MISGLKYIGFVVLLHMAMLAGGQTYVIDRVCEGSTRIYRIEGDAGSTYEWLLTTSLNQKIPLPNPAGTPFIKTNGTTIYGNEISIDWTKEGVYNLAAVQTSLLGCDTLEQGIVEVYKQPTAMAGNPLTICTDSKVYLTSAFADNYGSLLWTSSGDGVFADPLALHTEYAIGPNDALAGSVKLTLTATGKGNGTSCNIVSSTLLATLKVIPKLVINDPPEVCLPTTIDLSSPSITAGSESGLTFEYFKDSMATITLANYMALTQSGTYYIRGTNNVTGCALMKPVKVRFTKQTIPSFAHISEICLNSVNPPVLPPSDFLGISGSWSPAVIATDKLGIFPYKFTPDPGQCAKDTTILVEISNSIKPLFNIASSFCLGSTPPALPKTSGNGISGTWIPAAINTSSTGTSTYTFTPDAGQCAIPATISITITFPASPPTFTFAKKLCIGSIPPSLPNISSEGVSGIWSPPVIATGTVGIFDYEFIPSSGQCVQKRIEKIEIFDKTLPVFDPIGPLCKGSTPVVLPAISKNGISGTWLPATVATNLPGIFNYTFTPYPGSCADPVTMLIEIYNDIKLTITHDPLTVYGGTTTITVTATGGSGIFSSGTGTFTRPAGWQRFTVFDNHGCSGTDSVFIANPQDLDLTASVVPIKCLGGYADITLTVTGGTPPYSFTYTGGNPIHQKLSANTFRVSPSLIPYVFKVTDSNNFYGELDPMLITAPPGMTLSSTFTRPTCFGGSDATATVFSTNAMGSVTYQWDDPMKQTTATATGLKAGTYTVVVTDECGPKSLKIPITDPPAVVLAAAGVASVCPGYDGAILFTLSNAPDGTYIITHSAGQFNSVEFKGGKATVSAPPGTYSDLKIVHNTCSSLGVSAKVGYAVRQKIDFILIQPNCKVPSGGVFVTNPKSGSGFEYSVNNSIYQSTTTFVGLNTGVNSLKVRKISTGCETDTTFTIDQQPATPAPIAVIPIAPECEASPVQTLNANNAIVPPPAGTSIIWYDKAVGGNVVSQPILNAPETITYYAEATNGICTSNIRTAVTLTIIKKPDAPVSTGDLLACESTPMVTLDARKTIVNGKNIVWYDSPVGGNVVASPTLNTVKKVTYYAVEFNGICASAPRTPVTLEIAPLPSQPVVAVTTKPTCKNTDGIIEVLSPLGANLSYSIDNGPYQVSPVFAKPSGSHVIKVKNMLTNCESDTTVIKVPDLPTIPKMKKVTPENCICYGDTGAIHFEFENVADGTYVIIYMGGQFENVIVKNNKATVLAPAGTYNVLAIEANGCTSTEKWDVIITQPDRIVVSANVTEIDLKSQTQGSIELTITGGTGPLKTIWQPNLLSSFGGSTKEDIYNLRSGEYTVTVTDKNGCTVIQSYTIPPNRAPIAMNDEFYAGCSGASGDIVYGDNGFGKDYDPDGDTLFVDLTLIEIPKHGKLILNPDQSGKFTYMADQGYTGIDQFQYVVFDKKKNLSNPAKVTIHVVADFDCDGIEDNMDPDADADGILNLDEGSLTDDSDGDGHPNWLDIDADNDGIVDNFEGQTTAGYIPPSGVDTDHDGIDNAYDTDHGGSTVLPTDTDGDGIPDFLDVDSDNDMVPDYIEGHDLNADGKPDFVLRGKDVDTDGLDDGFDTVNRYESYVSNSTGSNAAMQDFDGDGQKDWRDENDDDDQYLTRFEDLNVDGNYANDDTDFDGHPEYLDYGRDCDLFIPEAFSPNDDNIHDYFQVYCINHYPNARMFIFDQSGNKLYEKDHYGNMEFWGTADRAWWDGRTSNRAANTINGKVAPGTYYYVLQLGNGEVRKSFVFVSY